MRKKFLLSIHHSIEDLMQDERLNEERRMELLAFCILTKIDGESCDCGPFALKPLDEKGKEGKDIAGCLHHEFMDIREIFVSKQEGVQV